MGGDVNEMGEKDGVEQKRGEGRGGQKEQSGRRAQASAYAILYVVAGRERKVWTGWTGWTVW